MKIGINEHLINIDKLQSDFYFVNVYSNSNLEISDKFIILR
jgi:hypothetical protein